MNLKFPSLSLKLKLFFGFLILLLAYLYFSSINFVCSSGIIVPSETFCIFQKPISSNSTDITKDVSYEYAYKKSQDFMVEAISYNSKINDLGAISNSGDYFGLNALIFPFESGMIKRGSDAGDKIEVWLEYKYYLCWSSKCPDGYICNEQIFCTPKTTYGHFFISKINGEFAR